MAGLLDILQGASNSAASNVSAPVDGLAWLLRKAGLPIPSNPVGGSDWMAQKGFTAEPENKNLGLLGEAVGGAGQIAAAAKAAQIAKGLLSLDDKAMDMARSGIEGYMDSSGMRQNAILHQGKSFDPRFDPRIKEQERLRNLVVTTEDRAMRDVPTIDLSKYEGHPFITSMSDRTAAGGKISNINGVDLRHQVDLRGGQDFMFDGNDGQVWASASGPVKQLLGLSGDLKRVTGKDPLYMPWRMAPSGGDFANMTGETMLSYAGSNMGKGNVKRLDKDIRQLIPNWAGVTDPSSIEQFRRAPDKVRKSIKGMMDVNYRDSGGLSLGEARLAVADPKQLTARDGGIMNIGQIDSGAPMVQNSGHPAYPKGVAGEGLGRVADDIGIFQLLPQVAKERGLLDLANPRATDIRALQMKPYAGVLSEDILRSLGY